MEAEIKLKRYLVRRNTSDVFAWTAQLSKRAGLDEVYARDAKEALTKEAMPDPRNISLDQLERMSRGDLIIFAEAKLGVQLPNEPKAALLDIVKSVVFTLPPPELTEASKESRPYANVSDVRSARTAGDTAKIEGTHAGNQQTKGPVTSA
jgi:hypothetical protein